MRAPLPEPILSERVIPVARRLGPATAPVVVEALRRGGLSTIEITVEGSDGFSAIAAVGGGDAIVGAGTVMTVQAAERAVSAGAVFLVSPHFDVRLASWAAVAGVPWIPGALTPSEVAAAWEAGSPAVKLFPASLGGPDYVRALLAPLPEVPLIPTGGVDEANIGGYLEAGAVAVGVGDWLTGHPDPGTITERASRLTAEVV